MAGLRLRIIEVAQDLDTTVLQRKCERLDTNPRHKCHGSSTTMCNVNMFVKISLWIIAEFFKGDMLYLAINIYTIK